MIDRLADHPAGVFPRSTYSQSNPQPATKPAQPWMQASDLGGFVQPVEKLVLNYPAAALASAFLVGVALAWWIKRK